MRKGEDVKVPMDLVGRTAAFPLYQTHLSTNLVSFGCHIKFIMRVKA